MDHVSVFVLLILAYLTHRSKPWLRMHSQNLAMAVRAQADGRPDFGYRSMGRRPIDTGMSFVGQEGLEDSKLEMGRMPLSPDGISMCQTRGVEAQAEGEGIHGGGYHHRRRSRKDRVRSSPGRDRRAARIPEEAVVAAVRAAAAVSRCDGGVSQPVGFQSRLGRLTC